MIYVSRRAAISFLLLLMTILSAEVQAGVKDNVFAAGNKTFLLNGTPFVVKAAELHYPRIPKEYWDHRIKMCKALGMNTICMYIFWNYHEQKEGVFDFTGNADIAEFCRLVHENGMYVIVRPGPYVCAEWEMGGLPWWLLKEKDIKLREDDPLFLKYVERFEKEVGKQLSGLTIDKGGPIIMVQVENEYGSYGEDKTYISKIRDIIREAGFSKVMLFQCDWASNFTKNGLDDLLWTMNFGTGADIDSQFEHLRKLRPDTPLMCSEFWSGWFDKWGARHETRQAHAMVGGIEEMLSKNISFSLYMTHGGTSFGHWAGANSPGYAPDVTSYDYDAPINEYGMATEKYHMLRETMQRYSSCKLPPIPQGNMPIISIPAFRLEEFAPMEAGITKVYSTEESKTFEELDMGWGTMVYSVELPETTSSGILYCDIHDYAQYFIDNKYIGKTDRTRNEKSIVIPPARKGSKLNIVVEAMGRINFGRSIKDFKGIVGEMRLSTENNGRIVTYNLKNWSTYSIPAEYSTAVRAFEQGKGNGRRGFYRGLFNLEKPGDTFLNFETWGKGMVWVNGHAMGRMWYIGPQQTLYVPGCWLKEGENEIIVLDILGPTDNIVWGQAEPELNKLQIEKNDRHSNIADIPDLKSVNPAATGEFRRGNGWQTVEFSSLQKGRYVAIECLSAHDSNQTAIAEIYLKGADGKRLHRESWTTKYASSEQHSGNNYGEKSFDLQESTYWQTEEGTAPPHLLVVDLGEEQLISAMEYLPRAEQGAPGSIKGYKIYVYK